MSSVGPQHLSQLSLDLLLIGDLAEADVRGARLHIEACPDCRRRFEELERAAEDFEQRVYPRSAPAAPSVPARAPRSWRRWSAWMAAAAAVAGAAMMVFWLARPASVAAPLDDLRQKGDPIFTVYARHGDRVFTIEDGTRLEPGDSLRFTGEPGGYSHLLIASIDSAGRATVYFPYHGAQSAPIDQSRRFEDDASIVLDATRGPERIFAFFSRVPMPAGEVVPKLVEVGKEGPDGIRRNRRLSVAGGVQASVLIEK